MKQENSYKHIVKYTGLFGGVQLVGILVGLVRTKCIAVILGPVGVGLISIFNTATAFLQSATNFGLQMSGVREMSQAHDSGDADLLKSKISLVRTWSLITALLGFVVTLCLSGVLSSWAFSNNSHVSDFLLLAPVVAFAAIIGGETAMLKACRRLKALAALGVSTAFVMLLVSLPLYIMYGNSAIVPSLLAVGAVQLVVTLCVSCKHQPYRLVFRRHELSGGKGMIVVGTAFVVAGVIGSGAEFYIRTYLSDMSVSLAGLYNAGYMISMTYAGMVFAAMETDYFPKLSAVCADTDKMNTTVGRQIEVSLTIVSPLLVGLIVFMPMVIPILFSEQFLPVVSMTQITLLAMYLRAVNLPVAYINLAKGESKAYMFMEIAYFAMAVGGVVVGFSNWGLTGTGIALVLVTAAENILLMMLCTMKYGLQLPNTLIKYFLLQFGIGITTVLSAQLLEGIYYWLVGAMMIAASCAMSYRSRKWE